MDRKDFLSSLGITAAAFTLINCLGCSKTGSSPSSGTGTTGSTTVDFTLDITASGNTALQTNGGFVITNGVIIARTTSGNFIAVQQSCTHQNYTLAYEANNQLFYCANHGAEFSEAGAVLRGPASRSLKTYNTSLTGSSLRVYA